MHLGLRRIMVVFLKKKVQSIKRLMNWLVIVASAAPDTPISKTNMNRGSSPTLIRPPAQKPSMDLVAWPSALKMLFKRNEAHMIGAPRSMILA